MGSTRRRRKRFLNGVDEAPAYERTAEYHGVSTIHARTSRAVPPHRNPNMISRLSFITFLALIGLAFGVLNPVAAAERGSSVARWRRAAVNAAALEEDKGRKVDD